MSLSCTQEIFPEDKQNDNCIKLTVTSSSMRTKVIDNVYGESNERVIKRLDCFFYVKGNTNSNCIHYKKITGLNADGIAEIPIYVNEDLLNTIFPSQSTCDVYVIANLPDNIEIPQDTDITSLGSIVVTADEFKDAIKNDGSLSSPKAFVMEGLGVATRDADDVSGNIPLQRVASKITMNIKLPEYIETKVYDSNGKPTGETEIWRPLFANSSDPSAGINDVFVGFHNGTAKDYIREEYKVKPEDYFETPKKTNSFEFLSILEPDPEKGETVRKYLYRCDAEFYSYSSKWEQGELGAPYLTLVIPWKKDGDTEYQTFYYQVLINAATREFEPNHWYDLTLNVGVLGSVVEAIPVEITELSYYVLDWSTYEIGNENLNEDVDIFEWKYLIVHEKRIVMNNTPFAEIHYDASHNLGYALEWPADVEGLDELEIEYNYNTRKYYEAYYINCGATPAAVELTDFIDLESDFDLTRDALKFTYPEKEIEKEYEVFSPVYIHLKVWLNIDGENDLEPDEEYGEDKFVEHITLVYYPPIYIIPDESISTSVYINGVRNNSNTITFDDYSLGKATGTSSDGKHMFSITVTSFSAKDKFKCNNNNDSIPYIIGDPRLKSNDIYLNNDGYDTTKKWASYRISQNPDVYKTLDYYYPTATEGDAYRVISPKFRVASFFGGHSSGSDHEGAAMRCASYQEDGFPAGRWRLPTTAEIVFVIGLQEKHAIQGIFYGTNWYYSSTEQVQNNGGIKFNTNINDNTKGSIRCVYDEWYWGEEREADLNPGGTGATTYKFTWGDEEIIW